MPADQAEELVSSLLYEGYALYPYTPSAIKNSTPTPFGIVYPPAYAERSTATFDHVRLDCALRAGAERVTATVRFLQAGGAERRIDLVADEEPTPFEFDGLSGRARLRTDPLPDGGTRVRCCVHNTTDMPDAAVADRAAALLHSLLSTHVLVRAEGGRFASPLDAGLESVNTYPVLASDSDDAVMGAAIILPDHPQIAPESKGNLFDNTEIEEALLLHVHVLSDGERAEIEMSDDPALRAMLARADAATPQDFMALHGRLEMKEKPELRAGYEPSGFKPDGELEVEIDGVVHRVGSRVRLQPGRGGDTLDSLLTGRVATIGKIFIDYDGRTYLGVTVDDDPAAELFGETGRFLFFGPEEVEVVGS
jgi:hypothetical protein